MTDTSISTQLFVINPISGGKEKTEHESMIKKFYESLPDKIEFFLLQGKNDAQNLDKVIAKLKPQTVVAVGGDGTVSMVAKRLLGKDIHLGILPAGSANGMARELSIPVNIEEALNIIKKGHVKKTDVLSVNKKICLHLSDIGLNAHLIKYFEQGNTRGIMGYAKVALKVFFRRQNIRVIIQTPEQEIKRDALMVVLANASKYGTGFIINPDGDLYDGLFEVVVMRNVGLLSLFKMWMLPSKFDKSKIEVFSAKAVHIETHRKVHFQVDGEYLGKVKHVDAEILAGSLNILLPE